LTVALLQGGCALAVVGITAGVNTVYCCDVRDLCIAFATAVRPAVAFAAVNGLEVQLLSLLLTVFLLLLLLLLTTFCLLGVPTDMASMLLLTCLL
jgi:hypothetical protein